MGLGLAKEAFSVLRTTVNPAQEERRRSIEDSQEGNLRSKIN